MPTFNTELIPVKRTFIEWLEILRCYNVPITKIQIPQEYKKYPAVVNIQTSKPEPIKERYNISVLTDPVIIEYNTRYLYI